jgi:hypothetical protein
MKLAKTKKGLKPRKNRGKTKRFIGGVLQMVPEDNVRLTNLVNYVISLNHRRPPTRERLNELLTISPWATYSNNYLLQVFMQHIITHSTDRELLNNIITRTIAEHSEHLINKTIVLKTVIRLMNFNANNKYINEISLLLHAIPPIKSQSVLRKLYKYICLNNPSPQILQIVFDANHFLTKTTYYNEILEGIDSAIDYCIRNIALSFGDEYLAERLARLREVKTILENMSPAMLKTSYIMYPAMERGIQFPPDVIEELSKHNNTI